MTFTLRGAVVVSVVVLCASGRAAEAYDIVHLRTGDTLDGRIVEETDTYVKLEVNRGTLWIARSDIAMIKRHQQRGRGALKRLKKLAEAIATPNAIQSRSTNVNRPSQDWRNASKAMSSYKL